MSRPRILRGDDHRVGDLLADDLGGELQEGGVVVGGRPRGDALFSGGGPLGFQFVVDLPHSNRVAESRGIVDAVSVVPLQHGSYVALVSVPLGRGRPQPGLGDVGAFPTVEYPLVGQGHRHLHAVALVGGHQGVDGVVPILFDVGHAGTSGLRHVDPRDPAAHRRVHVDEVGGVLAVLRPVVLTGKGTGNVGDLTFEADRVAGGRRRVGGRRHSLD